MFFFPVNNRKPNNNFFLLISFLTNSSCEISNLIWKASLFIDHFGVEVPTWDMFKSEHVHLEHILTQLDIIHDEFLNKEINTKEVLLDLLLFSEKKTNKILLYRHVSIMFIRYGNLSCVKSSRLITLAFSIKTTSFYKFKLLINGLSCITQYINVNGFTILLKLLRDLRLSYLTW